MTEAASGGWREQLEEPDPVQARGPVADALVSWTSWLACAQERVALTHRLAWAWTEVAWTCSRRGGGCPV